MARTKKPASRQEITNMFSDAARLMALRPSIKGYQPQEHQIKFHNSQAKGRLFIGGNRSGKTVGGGTEATMWLTGQHISWQKFAPPIRGRIVAVDFDNGVNKIVLPEIMKWMPPSLLLDGSFERSYEKSSRTLTLTNGSTVEFMSYDQDTDKFAGTSRHFVWFDEEPPQSIFDECLMRLVDTGGNWWCTMTPVEDMCFDAETEVLTARGFKKYFEILPDDILLTYNIEEGYTEWQELESLFINPSYEGLMYKVSSIDSLTSNHHKWVVEGKGRVMSMDLNEKDKVIIQAPYKGGSGLPESPDFFWLLGFIVGDGTTDTGRPTTTIYQVKKSMIRKVHEVCKRLGLTYVDSPMKHGKQIRIWSDEIKQYLNWEKMPWGDWIKDLSVEQALALWQGFVDSDGTTTDSGSQRVSQTHKGRTDFIAAVGVLTGKRITITNNEGTYKVQQFKESARANTNVTRGRTETSRYKGLIWCPSVANQSVVARRGKDIYITGNTWTYDGLYMPAKEGKRPDIELFEVSSFDNAYINRAELEVLTAGLSEEDRAVRLHGTYIRHSGTIYGEYIKPNTFVPDIITGENWGHYRSKWNHYIAMDHGYTNATAFLFFCVDSDENVILYDEYYATKKLIKENAEAIHTKVAELGIQPLYYVGDPAIVQTNALTGTSVQMEYLEHGIPIITGNNAVQAGINRVAKRLMTKKLLITDRCENVKWELNRYRWARHTSRKVSDRSNKKETPLKKDDHAMDALRYGMVSRPALPGELELSSFNNNLVEASRAIGMEEGVVDWALLEQGTSSSNDYCDPITGAY